MHRAHVPRRCLQTDMSYGESAGEPKPPDQASRLEHLPLVFQDVLHAGVGTMCISMRIAGGTPVW